MKSPILSSSIVHAFAHPTVRSLMERTLAEDFKTILVSDPEYLAKMTISKLMEAGTSYPEAAAFLALEVYPKWKNQNVRDLYHDYNWHVERAGSAKIAAPFIKGKTHIDIGGGPGTFSLEVMKLKEPELWNSTIVDIADYRNPTAKKEDHIHFHHLENSSVPPNFSGKVFDTGSLLYVLHHVESDHEIFLKNWARCIRRTMILFEDVKVDIHQGIPKRDYRPARKLESDFLQLSLEDQELFIAGIDYVCNHIASQALTMPVPGKYYEYRELEKFLQKIFPDAKITTRYHGIYDTKCYPNPEAMYVVEFFS